MTLEEITAKLAEIEKRLEPTFKRSYTRIELHKDGSGAIAIRPHVKPFDLATFDTIDGISKAFDKALTLPIADIVRHVEYDHKRWLAKQER